MLKHCNNFYSSFIASIYFYQGRAGVPFEVMGVMLGEFLDEFTVQVIDVYAMPQIASTVSVESVDPVF
jgi:26S proteasome regulatory subunit N11